ncbi:MAG: TIR domain-containing protein [Prevotella sp.]|nr:TIR domain-containing protein [Prevotella sp.]
MKIDKKGFKAEIEKQNARGNLDVFISYRSKEVDFVTRLYEEFKNNFVNAWFDKAILHENAGKYYPEIIHEGIRNSKFFLLIYTESIAESEFIIKQELEYAISQGKTILCYPKETPDFNKMEKNLKKQLESIQWLANKESSKDIDAYRKEIEEERKRVIMAKTVNDSPEKYSVYEDENLFLIRIEIQRLLKKLTPYGNYQTISKADPVYDWDNIQLRIWPKTFYIKIPETKYKDLEKGGFFKTAKEDSKKKEKAIDDYFDKIKNIHKIEENEILEYLKNFINSYDHKKLYNWMLQNRSEYMKPYTEEAFSADDFIKVMAMITSDAFIKQLGAKQVMFNGAMTGLYGVTDNRTKNSESHYLTMDMYFTNYFTFKCMVETYHTLRSIEDKFEKIKTTNIRKYSPFLSSLGLGGFVVINQDYNLHLMWTYRSGKISSGDMWHFSFDETSNILKDCFHDKHGNFVLDEDFCLLIDMKSYFMRALREEIGLSPDDISFRQGVTELGIIKSERLEAELLSYCVVDLPAQPSIVEQMAKFRNIAPDSYLETEEIEIIPLQETAKKMTGRLLTPESVSLSSFVEKIMDQMDKENRGINIAPTAKIGIETKIGKNCIIEDYSYIGSKCSIGDECKIHRNVFIDNNVVIGNRVKIQNNNSIYEGVTLEDGTFIGTNVTFINDRHPRAILKDGKQVGPGDWERGYTRVRYGASLGAGSVIMCGVTIGKWAMVAAGSVVLEDVPDGALVAGNPARIIKTDIPY